MDKARKTKIKRIIAAVCAVVLVAVLAAMPLIARNRSEKDGPKASILSGTVQTGTIDTKLLGGGTLAEEDAVSISIPTAVKLKKFLVTNGDAVSEGEPIATVDRVTVMTAIAGIQDTLDHLAEQIEIERKKDTDGAVTALAGGTVKILHAEQGESVQNVMLEHGALAVLSLDGLMAVDLTVESTLAVGDAVTVTLSNGTEAPGKVQSNLAGTMTVTIEDDGYPVEDAVQVTAEDSTVLGSGSLYIYNPWNAIAYAGSVSSVKVSVGTTVKAGDTLMTLTDMGYTAAYRQLVAQRQAYEDLMLDLFEMYQTEQIAAPSDGIISGVDENSLQLLSSAGKFTISLLANAPNGDDGMVYTNFCARVMTADDGNWSLLANPEALHITDYKDLSGIPLNTDLMTQEAAVTVQFPVYTLGNGEWMQVDASTVVAGDVLLFAFDADGNAVWAVQIVEEEAPVPDETEPPTEPEIPPEPDVPEDPTVPAESEVPTEPKPTDPTTPTESGIPNQPTLPSESDTPETPTTPSQSGSVNLPSGNFGSMGTTGSLSGIVGTDGSYPMEQEPTVELYGKDMTQIAAVTPQDTMTMEITIDELDITFLRTGLTAEVKINALGGEKFSAIITSISNTGSNNVGSSKFTVELTMQRRENMLAGMNASASIVIDSTAEVLTIPVEALVEDGIRTLVYTGYDEENACLTGSVTVTTGVSDGRHVQIVDGLNAGDAYYYAYYDTLEISYTPDFGGGMMFGR